jgi:hypothetical protein
MRRGKPTYDLKYVQALVARGTPWRFITVAARSNGALRWFDEQEIVDAVLELRADEFYKSMEAERRPGLWQDVYHTVRRGIRLYVKLQVGFDGRAVIVQFKER